MWNDAPEYNIPTFNIVMGLHIYIFKAKSKCYNQ